MNKSINFNLTATHIFWPAPKAASRNVFFVILGVCLFTIASQLSIPLEPVPLTFQSTTAVLIGMLFGARYGAAVIITYLFLGATGLPIFADFSGGLVKLVGPTGGYLAGFLPAAYVSGYLAQKGWANKTISCFMTACLGTSIIFASGIAWLATFLGWKQALVMGLVPFIVSEIIKVIAVAVVVPRLSKRSMTYQK